MTKTVLLKEISKVSSVSSSTLREERSFSTSQNRDRYAHFKEKSDNIIVLEVVSDEYSCGKGSVKASKDKERSSFDKVKKSIQAYQSTLKCHARWAGCGSQIIKNI